MRVLAVGNMYPPHHQGGYELVWRSAMEHLRAAGHEVTVLTTDLRLDRAEPDDPGTHRELRWYWRDGGFPRIGYLERIRLERHNHAVLRRHLTARPDVVAWWSMGGMSLSLIEHVNRRGIPAVAFVHDDWLDYGRHVDAWLAPFGRLPWLGRLAERLSGVPAHVDFGGVARWLFVSEATRARALAQGLGLRNTGVAHSGIHPAFLDAAPADPEWRWRLLYVGRLDERKGIDTAVEALARLPEPAALTVAGDGDERELRRLRDLAARLGVAHRLRFDGHCSRPELLQRYAAADAVVFPVRWEEPWGLVPLEAMGQRRPVVATGRGGSAEYLRDGHNCLLFPAGDAAALAERLVRLAGDAVLRKRLVEAGRPTALGHTEARFNAQVQEAVEAAAAQPARRATPGGSSPGGPKYSITRAGTPTATQ